MTIGYGHGFAVTPLHLVKAYASIINNGTMKSSLCKCVSCTKLRNVFVLLRRLGLNNKLFFFCAINNYEWIVKFN